MALHLGRARRTDSCPVTLRLPRPVREPIQRAPVAERDRKPCSTTHDVLNLGLDGVDGPLPGAQNDRILASREAAAEDDTAASGSIPTCSQNESAESSRTAVLPPPGPPVTAIRRGEWCSPEHRHGDRPARNGVDETTINGDRGR